MRFFELAQSDRFRSLATNLFIGLPIASLAIALVAWLRYGVDLPSYDDWRSYSRGMTMSPQPSYRLARATLT